MIDTATLHLRNLGTLACESIFRHHVIRKLIIETEENDTVHKYSILLSSQFQFQNLR